MSFSLKKDDLVKVISGKEKGKTGKILKILTEKNRALIEGVNLVKRHSRPTKLNPKGGIIEKPASIHISNLMYFDAKEGKALRIGAKILADGSKVRVFKKAGKVIEEKAKK